MSDMSDSCVPFPDNIPLDEDGYFFPFEDYSNEQLEVILQWIDEELSQRIKDN